MNKQSFIKLVKDAIEALYEQGCPSVNPNSEQKGCLYLNSQGYSCIVGFMMPDDTTRRIADEYPNTGITDLVAYGFSWTKQFSTEQILVLRSLQDAHDSMTSDWDKIGRRDAMIDIISKYEGEFND